MASAGEFPKADGDVYYGQDANMTYYNAALAGTMNYGNISVATTATLIKATNTSRKSILIRNNGSASLFIGGNNLVTTSNGLEVPSNQSIHIKDTDELYGIVATGTLDVRYLETQ